MSGRSLGRGATVSSLPAPRAVRKPRAASVAGWKPRSALAHSPSVLSLALTLRAGCERIGITEYYDGSSWTEIGDMATENGMRASAGSPSAALAAGAGPGSSTATEEWAVTLANYTITVS